MTDSIFSVAKPIARHGKALPMLLAALCLRWMRWQRRRRDQAALLRQPDYLLRDIGIERRDVERAIRGERMR
jgi:uncharacterized protein YjiS (DUF1127 family)